jgi:hypothetical protein
LTCADQSAIAQQNNSTSQEKSLACHVNYAIAQKNVASAYKKASPAMIKGSPAL